MTTTAPDREVGIHILFEFRDGPWGGANQFLKALRDHVHAQGLWRDDPAEADVLLFNCNPSGIRSIPRLRREHRRAAPPAVVLRIDGPISTIRGVDDGIDGVFFALARCYADATVYQSGWSRGRLRSLGMPESAIERTIINAPDHALFHRPADAQREPGPLRIVATSWSPNARKGFDIYRWLDQHLDHDRFQLTFIGNAPLAFKRIRHLPPMPSRELACELRRHDLYLTASRCDPCSNSLIEALHCGLPAIALRDGGHPEIVASGGLLFDRAEEIPGLLDAAQADLDGLRRRIAIPTMATIGDEYIRVCREASAHRRRCAGGSAAMALSLRIAQCRIRTASRMLIQSLIRRTSGTAT